MILVVVILVVSIRISISIIVLVLALVLVLVLLESASHPPQGLCIATEAEPRIKAAVNQAAGCLGLLGSLGFNIGAEIIT